MSRRPVHLHEDLNIAFRTAMEVLWLWYSTQLISVEDSIICACEYSLEMKLRGV